MAPTFSSHFFLARSSQRGDYSFRFVTERPKEQKWPSGPQEIILTLTHYDRTGKHTLSLSLSLSHARSRFSAKPVLNVNHDAHDVAETSSRRVHRNGIAIVKPEERICSTVRSIPYSLAECTLDNRWTWAIPNPRFSVAIFFFPLGSSRMDFDCLID